MKFRFSTDSGVGSNLWFSILNIIVESKKGEMCERETSGEEIVKRVEEAVKVGNR